jgi:thiamine-phosphate pyrophosphorylase
MSRPPATGGLDLFYPIVPDAKWVARIVPLGIRCVQLRIKDAAGEDVARQIEASLAMTRAYGCQLIVNDYWREALDVGADYVHLGQEDLASADIAAIKSAGLRLGVSTHSDDELATALAASPDYVALGPVYQTKLKVMPWAPQGLGRVATWKKRIGSLPLVAIGGITPERASDVIDAGADSVAVITDFMTAQDPERRIETWTSWSDARRRARNSHTT